MARVVLSLKTKERDALWALADRERREPKQQAELILVKELERCGLLSEPAVKANVPPEPANASA